MAEMLSPGVYVQEADYSEYVANTSTCIIGMVGGARRGPVGVPTLVTSQAQMVSTFGEPVEGDYGVYSALAALTRASQLYYTRIVRGGTKASAGVIGTDKVVYTSRTSGEDSNGLIVEQSALLNDLFTVTIKDSDGEVLETYEDVSLVSTDVNYIETLINGVSKYITAAVQYNGTIKESEFTLNGGTGTGKYARAGEEGVDKMTFRSLYYDSDLNGCHVVISDEDQYGYFDITIKDGDNVLETWSGVSIDPKSDRFVELFINTRSSRVVVTVNTDESVALEADTLMFSGGDNGIDGISVYDVIGEETGSGLYSFSNPETVIVDALAAPGYSDPEVISAAISICEGRGDTMFVADPPFGMTAQEILDWSNGAGSSDHKGFDSSYAALYWPWVKISDSYTKKNIWLPPSGYVLAQYAYNDEVAHPWNAPAGLERGIMTKPIGLEYNTTKGERDAVYGNRNVVNPIANFLGQGITIWGQKTMQRKPTALDRVNVRRLMIYLKRSIGLATRYFVFEQNDASTWERWNNMVEPILRDVRTNGGIYDYKIEIAPTESDVDNNTMPVSVSIKPTKTAEFIPLTFNITPYSASFEA